MVWTDRRLSLPEWEGTLDSLKETLEGVVMTVDLGRQEGIRADILALEALDELDGWLSRIKQDMGV